MNHKELALIVAVVLLAILLFTRPPNAYAWDASPQITSVVESGHTVLIIQFDFSQMSNPPTSSHYPFEYQTRTTENDEQYLEYPPVSIQQPTTAIFIVRYNFSAYIRYIFYVQARLHSNQDGWSTWGPPTMGAPVPEFPHTATLALATTLLASVYMLKEKKIGRQRQSWKEKPKEK